ncbi:MAG: hypothetical protein ABSG18_05355 [Steroidobacteraceae bacterium]
MAAQSDAILSRLFLNAERNLMLVRISIGVSVPLLLVAAVLASAGALAAAQRLECTLTDTDAQSAVERRAIAIIFDEETTTMQLQEGGHTRNLTDVSISMTSMSGGETDMTIGVSRSSWRVVLQTYQENSVRTEYGICTISAQKTPMPPTR